MAIVIISIFMLIAVFLVAFIVGLNSKGEAKEAKKETPKETTEELKGWYTAEMIADYEKLIAEQKEADKRRDERLKKGIFEAAHYSKELENAENILFHAHKLKKISNKELQTRLKIVLDDLDKKYPNAMYFVTAFNVAKDPAYFAALYTKTAYRENVIDDCFDGNWRVDLGARYRDLFDRVLSYKKLLISHREDYER